jgi:hypothetical protein
MNDPTLRWLGTALCVLGIILTSFNIYPINIIFGLIGSILWATVGLRRNDYALFFVEFAAVVVYIAGVVYYLAKEL